jgi:hypothetical protein
MAKVAAMTNAQVKKIVAQTPKDKRAAVVCSLTRHSRIVTACFGYIYCGRCGQQIADKLLSMYSAAPECVQIGHNCNVCRTNFKKMTWEDTYLTPDPFTKAAIS